ncbi:protein-L-isoaspartate(D-aspartate) O-methyltransferase [Malonomonas rubra]|uniref:protein-L-isoaspartate(D-aspartate) O-methyltransferase n=1 Tax=Malonomonas rubra TaxID=57040 RepID=UPI0026E98E22|nr:protein-L-isoaspartate(D-aspartate) O-methyltransferase [Malonomonas rubra]
MLFAMPTKQNEMLATIEAEYRETAYLTRRSEPHPRVLQALADVPRRDFVPPNVKHLAYANSPLPIGSGQTISQPYIVALMTDLLNPQPEQRILEIGTGCGYQTAILAKLAGKVFSIEILDTLAERAALNLANYHNVELRCDDGYIGWPQAAPFDGIIVTAAASHVPEPLRQQLKIGGRLVIPVGLPNLHQELLLIERLDATEFKTESILGVVFVPLIRKHKSREENNTYDCDTDATGRGKEPNP